MKLRQYYLLQTRRCLYVLIFCAVIFLMPSAAFAQTGNNAQMVSHGLPATIIAGHTVNASVTFRNTGTAKWTSNELYRLGIQLPQENSQWPQTAIRIALPKDTAPNEEVTFSFPVTAPYIKGAYSFTFKMVQDNVEWFGPTTTTPVSVTVLPPVPITQEALSYKNIRGANIFDASNPVWLGTLEANEKLATIAEDLNINVVRINLPMHSVPAGDSGDNFAQHVKKLMDIYQAHNLKVIVTLNGYMTYSDEKCGWYSTFVKVQPIAKKVVEAIKDHPALFAWELLNEALSQSDGQGCTSSAQHASVVKAVHAMYALVKSMDENTPTTVSETGVWQFFENWTDISSFISFHWYPYPATYPPTPQTPLTDAQIQSVATHLIRDIDDFVRPYAHGLPIVNGEFGVQAPSAMTEADKGRVFQKFYETMRSKNIGSMFWHLLLNGNQDTGEYTIINPDGSYKQTANVVQSQFIPDLPKNPANLSIDCALDATTAQLTWTKDYPGTQYALRVNDLVNPWTNSCSTVNLGDVCTTQTSSSTQIQTMPNHTYQWWIAACNPLGCSQTIHGTNFSCTKQTLIPGDLNSDSHVDIFDYNLLITNFGKTGIPGFITSDIDRSGSVNLFDYNILISNFGK